MCAGSGLNSTMFHAYTMNEAQCRQSMQNAAFSSVDLLFPELPVLGRPPKTGMTALLEMDIQGCKAFALIRLAGPHKPLRLKAFMTFLFLISLLCYLAVLMPRQCICGSSAPTLMASALCSTAPQVSKYAAVQNACSELRNLTGI